MNKIQKLSLILLSSIFFIACGGDDDGDSGGVSNNACSLIGLQTKIINGTECSGESRSPVVKIQIVNPASNTQALCSGTMISSTAVLTAAHCFGDSDSIFTQIDVEGVTYRARSVTIHPQYAQGASSLTGEALFHDLAIIKLVQSPGLPIVPIVTSRGIFPDDIISIFGYGLDNDQNAGELRSGQARVDGVSADHILEDFDGDESNSCQGDSGGPAMFDINGQAALVGVTSTGTVEGCKEGDQSLYTNLQEASNFNFIRSQVPGVGTI